MGLMKLLKGKKVKPKFKITVERFDGCPISITSQAAKEIEKRMGNSREKEVYFQNVRCKVKKEERIWG